MYSLQIRPMGVPHFKSITKCGSSWACIRAAGFSLHLPSKIDAHFGPVAGLLRPHTDAEGEDAKWRIELGELFVCLSCHVMSDKPGAMGRSEYYCCHLKSLKMTGRNNTWIGHHSRFSTKSSSLVCVSCEVLLLSTLALPLAGLLANVLMCCR
jgi:hypothetical protein